MLDGKALGAYITKRYRDRGDRLFRMERLAWYDVPSQNRDRAAYLEALRRGTRPDTTALEALAVELADEARRGLVSERVRVLSPELTDDEAMSCDVALPIISRDQEIRILHRGEHPVPDVVDHDYWIVTTAAGEVHVLPLHYDAAGRFLGAEIITDPAAQQPYLRERRLAWAIAEPFDTWWSRHGELHRQAA